MPLKAKNDLWIKAAIAGGLWAGMEIIVGSWLHNLRLPFAGSILAAAGVMIMSGFYVLWPQKGLLWRAGLICALMKSVSPSAVIFGPMSGIMLEALIMEMFSNISAQRLPLLMLGGILAVASALLHKIISLLILFGFDIFTMYINLINFLTRQAGMEALSLSQLGLLLALVYGTTGSIAVFLGYKGAKQAQDAQIGPNTVNLKETKTREEFFTAKQINRYGLPLLFIHLFLMVAILYFLNNRVGLWIHFCAFAYLTWISFSYKMYLRRVLKAVFLVQMLLIPLFSWLFLGDISQFPDSISLNNLIEGLLMDERALLVVAAFTGISTEIRNPAVQALRNNPKNKQLLLALEFSFSSLPRMIDASKNVRDLFFNPVRFVACMLMYAMQWLHDTKYYHQNI